jgi:hypothetical protein
MNSNSLSFNIVHVTVIVKMLYFSLLAEKRVTDLVEQYEELKESGKLQKHIRKHRKRNVQKDRKRLNAADLTGQ